MTVEIDKNWMIYLTGPVEKVCEGVIDKEFFD